MRQDFRNMLFKLGDVPWCNYYLQKLAHLGDFTFTKEVQTLLKPEAEEKILDMGSGLGVYSKIAKFYVGVDISEEQLRFAKRRFAVGGNKYFVLGDIKEIEFSYKSFDKSMCIQVMHHLNDQDSIAFLEKLANFTKKKVLLIVRICPDVNSTFGERFFFRHLERGKYMRRLDDSLKLIEKSLKVLDVNIVQNRTKTGRSALIPCLPK